MPRPSDSSFNIKPRRKRRFAKQKRLDLDDISARKGSGFFANGVRATLGPIAWLWHVTTSTLGWSNPSIDGIGGAGGKGRSTDGIGTSSSGTMVVVFVVAATAGMLIFRASRKQRGIDHTQPHQSAASAGGERDARDGREAREDERNAHGERRYHNTTGDGEERVPEWSRGVQKMKPTAMTEASGERRLSLYDVLTGETPLPTPRGDKPDVPAAAATDATSGGRLHGFRSGPGGGSVGGIVPLGGGARRASIFDRIADVVFNEEQKEQNPVDAVAVREELDEEFQVSFREGAMGMTLTMAPDSRDAVVGKIVEQGQAFRAGVQEDDWVIGVGEHTVSSYGTVLAFMNIMGRPIELRFRKAISPAGRGGGGSGGGPIAMSKAGVGGGGSAAVPDGVLSTSPAKSAFMPVRGSFDRARGDSSSSVSKAKGAKTGRKGPSSPISPRSSSKVSDFGRLGHEVASSDAGFSHKMEHGVVVTKYGKKGAAAQRVLYLDGASMSVAWRELDARSPGHRRSTSLTNMMKGRREALPLAHLIEVVAGDDPDPTRPSERGSAMLREHCDESLLPRSFALQFKERSLEMTCDSHTEMRQLVTGFRDLKNKYGQ